MNGVVIGTWGKPDHMRGFPLGHPRDTSIAISRHREMFFALYALHQFEMIVFDPYFVALDRVPTLGAIQEVARYGNAIARFADELRSAGVAVMYGHNSHYCHPLSQNEESRQRSVHEMHYLAALAEIMGMQRVAIHLSGRPADMDPLAAACRVLQSFSDDELKRIAFENMTGQSGTVDNIIALMERFPVGIALDIGHLFEVSDGLSQAWDSLGRVAAEACALRPSEPLFVHLSQDVDRKHQPLSLDFALEVIDRLRTATDADLHIDVESPNRIDDAVAIRSALSNY